jgi:hypothetical protein
MAPLWLFRENFAHLVDCYMDGGYSDDTIVSCIVQERGYVCAHPYRAIFPHVVERRMPFKRYWNFITRQFFVTDTYSTAFNRSVVHSLAWLMVSSIYLVVMWIFVTPLIGLLRVLASTTSDEPFVWIWTAKLGVLSWPLWYLFTASVQFFTRAMVTVSNSVRPPEQHVECRLSTMKLTIGLAIHCMLMPISVITIMFSEYVEWAGVRYYTRGGKIWKVERPDGGGTFHSELASSSIARTLRDARFKELIRRNFFQAHA